MADPPPLPFPVSFDPDTQTSITAAHEQVLRECIALLGRACAAHGVQHLHYWLKEGKYMNLRTK